MMIKRLFLIVFLSQQVVFACPEIVKEGEPSPCTGIVFTHEQETKIRTDLMYYKELSGKYKQNAELDAKLLKLERDLSKDLRNELSMRESTAFWENSLFFILGAGLTGLVSYAAFQSIK